MQVLPEWSSTKPLTVLDPCAGDGAAIVQIASAVAGDGVHYYACELEESRHEGLVSRLRWRWQDRERALRGDVFCSVFEGEGVGLLYLNPPYDLDREHGRLEEKFLARFTRALMPGGVLVFVAPHRALAASAETLARHYGDVSCYRFAGADFCAYGQVALFARRLSDAVDHNDPSGEAIDLSEPDSSILANVSAWATDASSLPELPEPGLRPGADADARYALRLEGGLSTWRMGAVDLTALVGKFAPWHESTRQRGLAPVARVLPDLPVGELMHRTYEVAMPPRPAHIAAGIAAGLFNGRRIEPNDAASGLPPLLVKGVFDREWRTVEEKHNKDGDKTGELQVQQPKLVVTVLDLSTHKYHTIQPTTEASDTRDVSRMGIADLLARYGQSLTRVMSEQCRVLYDPRESAEKYSLAPLARPLYAAQAHAARACLALLRERAGRHPVLLGEIGSGKSSVSLAAAKSHGAKCVLIVCPPHLLDSWRGEAWAVWPEASFRVLESVADVDDIGEAAVDDPIVAVLSRETAKLGHGWVSAGATCPKCGGPTSSEDHAKKRARCALRRLSPRDERAQSAYRLALLLRPYLPRDPSVRGLLRDLRYRPPEEPGEWPGLPADLALEIKARALCGYLACSTDAAKHLVLWSLAAAPDDDQIERAAKLVHNRSNVWVALSEDLLLLCTSEERARETAAALPPDHSCYSYYGAPADSPAKRVNAELKLAASSTARCAGLEVRRREGKVTLDGCALGSVEAAAGLLRVLAASGQWEQSEECGEPLFQAVPQPRRYPLAKYIVDRRKEMFDFLILDEGHEYATEGSAQERAAHRLTTLGLPTILMSGSIMNGYAASLFTNMWALSPEFRQEFDRGEGGAFEDRYGYRKRLVQDREEGEIVAFGSQTDRVERSERDVGAAPGVLPLFLFRHLLPSAVTLHKADLRIDLPPLSQERASVEPSEALFAEYKRLLKDLTDQIKADRFKEGLAGKLFGALAEMPSFLDRATNDAGNGDGGTYEIRYPESCGGDLVAEGKLFPAKTILPKEQWMLDKIEAELAEGRRVMVFAWHVGLLPRLQRLIEARVGETAPILYADKVPTGKRQSWIDREIVAKKRRVMIANPVAIQTGLNNLVHFHTEIWHENPACNPLVYRQAVGRIDRIGAKLPTRVFFAHYGGTLQANLYDLLMAKVAISVATDGLDPESALRASGIVEDEMLTGLSIGKQLWAMVEKDFTAERAPRAPRRKAAR